MCKIQNCISIEVTLTSPIDLPSRLVTSACIKPPSGTSLAVQRLRLCTLKAGGSRFASQGATKPVHHNYQPTCCNCRRARAATTEALAPRAHALQQEKPLQREARTTGEQTPLTTMREKPVQQQRPSTAISNKTTLKNNKDQSRSK